MAPSPLFPSIFNSELDNDASGLTKSTLSDHLGTSMPSRTLSERRVSRLGLAGVEITLPSEIKKKKKDWMGKRLPG